jgi:hypothetical protein
VGLEWNSWLQGTCPRGPLVVCIEEGLAANVERNTATYGLFFCFFVLVMSAYAAGIFGSFKCELWLFDRGMIRRNMTNASGIFRNLLTSAYLAKCWDGWKAQLDWFLIVVKAREAVTVRGKILGFLLDVHISSAVITSSYHFSRRQRLWGDIMCPKTIKTKDTVSALW